MHLLTMDYVFKDLIISWEIHPCFFISLPCTTKHRLASQTSCKFIFVNGINALWNSLKLRWILKKGGHPRAFSEAMFQSIELYDIYLSRKPSNTLYTKTGVLEFTFLSMRASPHDLGLLTVSL